MNIVPPYPNPSFIFEVTFSPALEEKKLGFLEVSGLEIVREGIVLNELTPKTEAHFVTLKRALKPSDSFTQWYTDTIEHHKTRKRRMTITLLNRDKKSVASWDVQGALPVSWHLNTLNAMENDIAVETVVFSYTAIGRKV